MGTCSIKKGDKIFVNIAQASMDVSIPLVVSVEAYSGYP